MLLPPLLLLLTRPAAQTFATLFASIESPHFDVASDAYATARDLLTKHRATVAAFLAANYEPFFEQYARLVRSENYVTRRQSLKLLGELLLDRSVRTLACGEPRPSLSLSAELSLSRRTLRS